MSNASIDVCKMWNIAISVIEKNWPSVHIIYYYYYKPADYIIIHKTNTLPTNAVKQRHTTLLDNVQVVRWIGLKVLAIFITQGDQRQQ